LRKLAPVQVMVAEPPAVAARLPAAGWHWLLRDKSVSDWRRTCKPKSL